MKVIDILLETAEVMNLPNVKVALKSANHENETEVLNNPEVESLFNLLKLSIRELCTNYVPAVRIENVQIYDGEFKLSDLINYIRIKTVKKDGNVVTYKIINRSLKVSENGIYEVQYYTYPEVESLFEEVEFLKNLNSDVIVFGLSAYYCLSNGLFEDFHEMHNMYLERAECLKDIKLFTMPQRSWQ